MKTALLPLAVVAVAALPAALPAPQDDAVFRSGVSLVRVDAEAVDTGGKVVAGLAKEDFRVLDRGREQKLVNFSFEEEPLDLILLFDTGGSMRGKLLGMVRATQLGFNELRKGDRVCVRVYTTFSEEMLPFTGNLETVNQAILLKALQLKFTGNSKLLPAAREAALRFGMDAQRRRMWVILSITESPGGRDANELPAVRDLWDSDAVFSELLIDGARGGADAIVDKTGGETIAAGDPGEAFRESVHYLRSGYTMYYVLPEAPAGSERSLEVELTPEAAKRFPNVRIRARSGYAR